MNVLHAVERLIASHGGQLARRSKHRVYVFPNGRKLTISNSPSEQNLVDIVRHDIRNLLNSKPNYMKGQ